MSHEGAIRTDFEPLFFLVDDVLGDIESRIDETDDNDKRQPSLQCQ